MKKLWIAIFASLALVSACGGAKTAENNGNSNGSSTSKWNESSSSSAKPKAGDTVVFRISRESYGESKVDSVDGTRYKIPYGSNINAVDETDVYTLPKAGEKSDVKVGDFVVAKRGNELYWTPSEVTSVSDSTIDVTAIGGGGSSSLAHEKIITVHPAAREEFKKWKGEKAFETKAQSMRPSTVGSYTPKPGDAVVAAWGASSWYTAKVLSVSGDKAKIDWDVFNDSEISVDKVAPLPKVGSTGAALSAGSIVLVKPTYDKGTWNFAEVTSTSSSGAEVKFSDGKTKSIRADEYVALN